MPASSRLTTSLFRQFIGALIQFVSIPNHPIRFNTHGDPGYIQKNANPSQAIRWRTVVKLSISCQNSRTCVTLLHTNQLAHCCGNHTTPPRENKIQHSDVFSISTTEPSDKEIMPFSRSNFHTHFSVLFI